MTNANCVPAVNNYHNCQTFMKIDRECLNLFICCVFVLYLLNWMLWGSGGVLLWCLSGISYYLDLQSMITENEQEC